jgi:hypothetical protein
VNGAKEASNSTGFAERIRSFVAGMPNIETARHGIKRQLAERFTLELSQHQEPHVERATGKDLDRERAPR